MAARKCPKIVTFPCGVKITFILLALLLSKVESVGYRKQLFIAFPSFHFVV